MKLTEQCIEDLIESEETTKLGKKTTVVVLTLKCGFEVVGTSACVNPDDYNHDIGVTIARKKAVDKVWELHGYLVQSGLLDKSTP